MDQAAPRILSVRAVALRTSLSERQIWRKIAQGKLRKIQLSCKRVGVPVEDAERLERGEAV